MAYLAFTDVSNNAAKAPTDLSRQKALQAHAVDPALANEGKDLLNFRLSNIAWRGEPPVSRVAVTRIATSGPYPTVTLTDCPTVSSTWSPYNTQTGKPARTVHPKVPPPWLTTATVIFYKNRWLVQNQNFDMTRTCTR